MTRGEMIEEIQMYCKKNIEDFELRVEIAWDNIDHWRCPLSYAAPDLDMEIHDKAVEWFEDNCDGTEDEFDEMFYDMEDFIIW